jgi:C_GCAxxG_C_C family probable redox protein
MVEDASQRSGELFDAGYYCVESVLLAIAESSKVQSDLIPRIATGFCSGLSRTCGMCGAVTGAVMGISLLKGRDSPTESVEENYTLVSEFLTAFGNQFGSTNCRDLIDCDLSTEEGQRGFKENSLHEDCRRYVEEATRLAMSLIAEKG